MRNHNLLPSMEPLECRRLFTTYSPAMIEEQVKTVQADYITFRSQLNALIDGLRNDVAADAQGLPGEINDIIDLRMDTNGLGTELGSLDATLNSATTTKALDRDADQMSAITTDDSSDATSAFGKVTTHLDNNSDLTVNRNVTADYDIASNFFNVQLKADTENLIKELASPEL